MEIRKQQNMLTPVSPKVRNSGSKISAYSNRKPVSKKLKAAPAPTGKRLKAAVGKRCFRQFSAKNPFKPKANEAYRIDHSPFQLSMRSVKLGRAGLPLGMDESRKQKQQSIIWYWQWSRDWTNVRNDNIALSGETSGFEKEDLYSVNQRKRSVWYLRWKSKQSQLKRLLGAGALNAIIKAPISQHALTYFGPSR